jgi:LmbE family N-acetylglucosaminyl deacetylase
MAWIYLSPHLDDAALCAGGLIFEQVLSGEVVEIWTLMAGVPKSARLSAFAAEMHGKWSTTTPEQTVHLRRQEDRRAAAILGAKVVHFDFLDSIYRTAPDGTALYGDPVGAPVHPHDAGLALQITQAIAARLDKNARIVSLLGIGDHVDHVVARDAAEKTSLPVYYVADFPYVLRHLQSLHAKVAGLGLTLRAISEPGIAAWMAAVEAYGSQLGAVFEELEPRTAIRKYCEDNRGVRVWCGAGLDSSGEP